MQIGKLNKPKGRFPKPVFVTVFVTINLCPIWCEEKGTKATFLVDPLVIRDLNPSRLNQKSVAPYRDGNTGSDKFPT
jgi:hypothetical protein